MPEFQRPNCRICLDWLDGSTNVVVTSCMHVFHDLCLDRYSRSSPKCPACRSDISSVQKILFSTAAFTCSESSEFLLNTVASQQQKIEAQQREIDILKIRALFRSSTRYAAA
ncbi:hypothetical protein QR680_004027 [Steinernema hermaphroditum]|uniref:RING-type domain-containing protein n=1 Tax=Steinernema hermaphroditum TaxID=289476 RepID=A0AA39HMF1_9BILA|nr:hypothetical protein QR680_004027 [Steinernema hermaphroditum]